VDGWSAIEELGDNCSQWGEARMWDERTTSQTGHSIAFTPPILPSPPMRRSLLSIMPRMASRSKLCGHFMLLTGSRMGRSVMGHLMLMRSDATWKSSSSSPAPGCVPGAPALPEALGESCDEGNQVEEWGMGGAVSPGYWASWTIFLKPM